MLISIKKFVALFVLFLKIRYCLCAILPEIETTTEFNQKFSTEDSTVNYDDVIEQHQENIQVITSREIQSLRSLIKGVDTQLGKFNNLYLGRLDQKLSTISTNIAGLDSNIKNIQERAHVWDTFQLHVAAWNEQIKSLDRKVNIINSGQEKILLLESKLGVLLNIEYNSQRALTKISSIEEKLGPLERSAVNVEQKLDTVLQKMEEVEKKMDEGEQEKRAKGEAPRVGVLYGQFATRGVLSTLKEVEARSKESYGLLQQIAAERRRPGNCTSSMRDRKLVIKCSSPPGVEEMLRDVASKVDLIYDKLAVDAVTAEEEDQEKQGRTQTSLQEPMDHDYSVEMYQNDEDNTEDSGIKLTEAESAGVRRLWKQMRDRDEDKINKNSYLDDLKTIINAENSALHKNITQQISRLIFDQKDVNIHEDHCKKHFKNEFKPFFDNLTQIYKKISHSINKCSSKDYCNFTCKVIHNQKNNSDGFEIKYKEDHKIINNSYVVYDKGIDNLSGIMEKDNKNTTVFKGKDYIDNHPTVNWHNDLTNDSFVIEGKYINNLTSRNDFSTSIYYDTGIGTSTELNEDEKIPQLKGSVDALEDPEFRENCKEYIEYLSSNKTGDFINLARFQTCLLVRTHSLFGEIDKVQLSKLSIQPGVVVLQSRDDGLENFSRTWLDYKWGFGRLRSGGWWLGHAAVHLLTTAGSCALRVDLEGFDGRTAWAEYDQFRLEGEDKKYELLLGHYRGNASDSLSYHVAKPFSSRDITNDRAPPCCPCSHTYGGGGWWYDRCFESNLNGKYLNETEALKSLNDGSNQGIIWEGWSNMSLSRTTMSLVMTPASKIQGTYAVEDP